MSRRDQGFTLLEVLVALFIAALMFAMGYGAIQQGLTGRESVKAAQSYIWAHAGDFGIDPAVFKNAGVHVHVPAGAIPKDGPSAGVAMFMALVSLMTERTVRSDTAMTGEVTLTGLVLPIGGVKEKVLAAYRSGIRTVILPKKTEQDLMEDLLKELREPMKFDYATDIKQVLNAALYGGLEKEEKPQEEQNHRERPKRRKVEKAAAKAPV